MKKVPSLPAGTVAAVSAFFAMWLAGASTSVAQVAIKGEKIYTMATTPLEDGVIVIRDGVISAIGKATEIKIPEGYRVISGKIVTPGLIDAHSTVGVSGLLNTKHDQDQLESTEPIQPQLRAIDAYNAHDELVAWVRSHGITTVHTGHAPGELISGQTIIVKTTGNTVEEALVAGERVVAATLADSARKSGSRSPGTRGKMMSMLRAEFLKAQEYAQKHDRADEDEEVEPPSRDLRLESLSRVLKGELKLLVTADRAQDIASALRLAKEFDIQIWLDSGAESYLLVDEIKAAGVPVLIHPSMARATGEKENLSFETAAKLVQAGIPVALQSGYESYVPKTRVVLFEAAVAAANGLTFEQALATVTSSAARILGIEDRVGSLAIGMDGDVAVFDGDPFEYTSHCTAVVINGTVVSDTPR